MPLRYLKASILWLALQRAGVIDNAAIYDEVRQFWVSLSLPLSSLRSADCELFPF